MKNHKTDYVVMAQLLQRYYNEKELEYTADYDTEDFEKWIETNASRTSEQQKLGGGDITSLGGILNMSQEEADEKGVGEFRRNYLQKQQDEMGKQVFLSGVTYKEVVEAYMIDRGLTELPDDKYDFVEWLDKITGGQQ